MTRYHNLGPLLLNVHEIAIILKPGRQVRPEFVSRKIGDCGCPEEVWNFDGLDLTLHFEDGGIDAHLDGGDWGEALLSKRNLRISGEDELRNLVFEWALRMTDGPEL